MHWHAGDLFALVFGLLILAGGMATANTRELLIAGILMPVFYLIGRGNGAHR